MLNELDEERLDKWRWQAFVGEEASLDSLYQEAPDTASKRCLTKVGWWVVAVFCLSEKCWVASFEVVGGGVAGWQQRVTS